MQSYHIRGVAERQTRGAQNAEGIARAGSVERWTGLRPAFNFIAEQVDGKTIFVDPQSGNGDCGDYFMDAEVGETQILRIDDNDLTDLVFKAVRRRRA